MLTPDGRCKALDAAADGYVRAEAAATLVLRAVDSLTATVTEGAPGGSFSGGSAAVLLLGTAVNQDGRSSSLTAPNGPSQQALMRAAVAGASLPATAVNLLSTHGTGEGLGGAGCRGACVKLHSSGMARNPRTPWPPSLSLHALMPTQPLVEQAPPWATPSRWAPPPRCCCTSAEVGG